MYTLYSLGGSCSTGITILLKKLDVAFKIIQRGDVDNYSSLVPTNQVPALKDNELLITEGAAIALYVLEKHHNNMLPSEFPEKAEFLRWLMFNYSTLHPAYNRVITLSRCMEDSEPNKAAILQTLADKVSALWKIVDDRLATRQFMVGDDVTIIDYLITIYTSWGNMFPNTKIILGPNVTRLVKEVSALPEFVWAYGTENATFTMAP